MRVVFATGLIAVSLLLCSGGAHAEETNTSFYFVQLTDTHQGDASHAERLKQAIAEINLIPLQVECVVVTGDIMADKILDSAAVKRTRALFRALKMPVHFLPGNHDISRKDLKTTVPAYTKAFGPLLSQKTYQGVEFVFAYTEPMARSLNVEGYEPLTAIESAFKKAKKRPIIVFHHAPSVSDMYQNKRYPGWPQPTRTQWEALLNRYAVKAVIAGHFHRDEHYWLGSVPLYVAPPLSWYYGRQGAYRIYHYKNGLLSFRTQYLQRPKRAKKNQKTPSPD